MNIINPALAALNHYGLIAFACITFLPLSTALADQEGHTLAQDGKALYVISLAEDAIPAERTAAIELQKYLQKVTKAEFPIAVETDIPAEKPQIFVGTGKQVKALVPKGDWDQLGQDGILIKTVGQNLVLTGSLPRGSLYAVYQFLEDAVGCRWWTPDATDYPNEETLVIPRQDVAYTPPFAYREYYATSVREHPLFAKDSLFATIFRQNGSHQKQTKEWGNHYNILGFVHTFSKLLPPEKYFQAHPQWYTDPSNGNLPSTAASTMPKAQGTQLCLTNPEVLEELSKRALEWIRANPEAGYISISQNDTGNYCRCTACTALAEKEGAQSGVILHFVNAVAERIASQYPDFIIETLAYTYSESPPRIVRPAKNVMIRLALALADYGHPINSDWNAKDRDRLLAWAKIAPRLFLWTYSTNFRNTMFPHPNRSGFADDLRFFADHHVKGMFVQGDCYTNDVGDFPQLRTWLITKLLWNPNLDQKKLTKEFLAGYYGDAGVHLGGYLDLITHAFLAQNRGLNTSNADFSFLTLDVAHSALRLFEQAKEAVHGKPTLLNRVRREEISLKLALLYRTRFLQSQAEEQGIAYLGQTDINQAASELAQTAKEFGVRNWGEYVDFDKGLANMLKLVTPKLVELPGFAKNKNRSEIIDFQPDAMVLSADGDLTAIENDDKASGGTAAMMKGGSTNWIIQAHLGPYLNSSTDQWRLYVVARIEGKGGLAPNKAAFQGGIFDVSNMKKIDNFHIPFSRVSGQQYHTIDLGTHQLAAGMYIWFAPLNLPGVEKVYIDRILLIRESSSEKL